MSQALTGIRIGVLQARHAEVLASLLRQRGGEVMVAPVLREETVEDLRPLRETLERLASDPVDVAVFQTGVGAVRLLELAASIGLDGALRRRLAEATVLARGPKPLAALHRFGIRVDRRTLEPHTTAEVISLLDPNLEGRTVFVQHHGAPNAALTEELRGRGAQLLEAHPYRWALPEDMEILEHFFAELEAGRIDVTLFTSAAQVVNLFAIAEHFGRARRVARALREKTLIASVGPTTTAALAEHHLRVTIQPGHPKMVPLADAVAAHFSKPS